MLKVQITFGASTIPLDVPQEDFVAEADVAAIVAEIPGSNSFAAAVPGGGTIVSDGDPKDKDSAGNLKGLFSITFDPVRWPNAKFAEPAFVVLAKKAAKVAAGIRYSWKEEADGYPDAVALPVVVIPPPQPPALPPGAGGIPGLGTGQAPVWMQQIQAIYAAFFPTGQLKQ